MIRIGFWGLLIMIIWYSIPPNPILIIKAPTLAPEPPNPKPEARSPDFMGFGLCSSGHRDVSTALCKGGLQNGSLKECPYP